MNFNGIRDFVCAKVSKTDQNSKDRCFDFINARDKMIYDGFDWRAAQLLVEKNAGAGTVLSSLVQIGLPEVTRVLSMRLSGILLEPVTADYIFESATATKDDYTQAGTPHFYSEVRDTTGTGQLNVKLYPPALGIGIPWDVVVLGKAPYNDTRNTPSIPETESALIAFALADMWEYLHEVGKAQAKFQEAQTLLQAAQAADTPGTQRRRRSKIITPSGNSLGELADSVCDIINDWAPAVVNSVKNRIHRNHQAAWDSMLWPETTVMASVSANGGTAILPHLIDKIIGVRINLDATNNSYQTVSYADSSILLGMSPEIFNQTGTPLSYNILLPVALSRDLVSGSTLQLQFATSEIVSIDIRGEANGNDVSETLVVSNSATPTVNSYDYVYSLNKPYSSSTLTVRDNSGRIMLNLLANEQYRKYARIQLLPAFDSTDNTIDQTVFVLGKRQCPNLITDGDVSQLVGVENFLINASVADMLSMDAAKLPLAMEFRKKADAAMKILVSRETTQQTYQPMILPYTEPNALSFSVDTGFLG